MANNIVMHQFFGITVGMNKLDGYLNATKLCQAYNLQFGTNKIPRDWTLTKRATGYISYVSSVRGITQTLLVVVKQGGHDEQGTWIHPDLGNAFASWLSVEYEYQVSKLIQQWHQDKLDREFPTQITGSVATNPVTQFANTLQEVVNVIFADVEPEFRRGIVIEGVCAKHPELRVALEPHKPKMLLDAPLLTPTKIGELLEVKDGIKRSGIATNRLLCDRGLQVATGDKKLAYKAIGRGIEFSKVVADTASGHGKTIMALRWYESIADILID